MGRLVQGVNDLLTLYPNIAKEFDIQKNNMLPSQISAGSHKKVWWLCSKGHSYQSKPNDRVNSRGCPCCAGKRASETNNLEFLYPDVAKEFDVKKNNILPTQILSQSSKKVWWICSNGHSYDMQVRSRTTDNQNCPICSGKRIVPENSLATLRPELLKDWDYEKNTILPTQIAPKTNRQKVWWKCSRCNNSWEATPKDKVGCPYCKWKPKSEEDSLINTCPDIINIWDYDKNTKKPEDYSIKSNEKVWLICKNGHSYEKLVFNLIRSTRCPKCIGKEAITGKTDLFTLYPNIVKEWDYDKNDIKPTDVLPHSKKEVWWKCDKGHSWKTKISVRVDGSNCPICRNIPSKDENIVTKYPYLLKEWDFELNAIKPDEIKIGSAKKVWWTCSKGHKYQCTIYNRLHNCGCIYCSDKISRTEQYIQDYLFKNNIPFVKEHIFDTLKNRRFDFYLTKHNLIIEVDGLQHFYESNFANTSLNQIIRADNQKNTYLLNNGIPILRVIGADTLTKFGFEENYILNETYKDVSKFIDTNGYVDDIIIQNYKKISKTNYADIAVRLNKLVVERSN